MSKIFADVSAVVVLLILLLSFHTTQILAIRKVHEVSKMLDYLVGNGPNSRKYDKTLRPNFGGSPVIVGVTINVDSLGPIDEVNMNFRLDLSFRQFWKDSRLDFSLYNKDDTYDQNLTLSHDFLTKIWVPDTYFPDSLSAFKQEVMVPNVLIRLSPDGSILYSSRTTVIAKCPMDLHVFPMDTQVCSLLVECYGYTTKDLSLQWHDGNEESVDITGNKQLAQFQVIDYKLLNYTLGFSTGSFSDLEIEFVFKRDLLYFILQSYIPSTLIVVCSWVAFWINREGIPGRACLSITTVLSLITLIGSTNAKLPNVSAVKALDVYFGICFGYVFGGLLEFATVIYLGSKEKKIAAQIKEKKEKQKEYLSTINSIRNMNLLQDLDPFFANDILKDSVSSAGLQLSPTGGGSGAGGKSPLSLTSTLNPDGGVSTSARLLTPLTSADIIQPTTQKLPRWTASRIEVYSRIWFPTSFVTLFTFYWVYFYVMKADYYLKKDKD
ncbi:gamma-aminobutyric acid receptor subunit pi-like isoform X2 [Convolutriloba macropyga]|uniref:gamma-aminobutyric acid receptor subunit pi-like isoform X2 n=1 Tax=Convolutriloba macropyga TaxID=536237 RepID=UPI003F51CCB1